MRRTLAILLLALLIPCYGWCLELTPAEADYVRANPVVRISVHPAWMPFEWVDAQGVHSGIAADLLALAAHRAGLKLEAVSARTWLESQRIAREGKAQLVSFINTTPSRDEWLIYTQPLMHDTNIFVTLDSHPFITTAAALTGETIVLPQGTATEEVIRRRYPHLNILVADTEEETLRMVAERKADITVRSFIATAFLIQKRGYYTLKIAGILPDYSNHLRIGVVKSEPLLRDILDKGIATITTDERNRIIEKHMIGSPRRVDYTLVYELVLMFLALLALGGYWNIRLKRLNRELKRLSQTDKLTGLFNRIKIDEQLTYESGVARRYERPFSVIIADVDHFKLVNDELGHLTGDRVLADIANILWRAVRSTDMVGRWGGEEFIILCPETELQEAQVVAERIRTAVAAGHFTSARKHSISCGVAQLAACESTDDFLSRADQALYQAKQQGRDQVVASPECCSVS